MDTFLIVASGALLLALLLWLICLFIFFKSLTRSAKELDPELAAALDEPRAERWKRLRQEGDEDYADKVLEATREKANLERPSVIAIWLRKASIHSTQKLSTIFGISISFTFILSIALVLIASPYLPSDAGRMGLAALIFVFGLVATLFVLHFQSGRFDQMIGGELLFVLEQIICVLTSGLPIERGFRSIGENNLALEVCPYTSALIFKSSLKTSGDPLDFLGEEAKRLQSKYLFHVTRILKGSQRYASERTRELRELKETIRDNLKIEQEYGNFQRNITGNINARFTYGVLLALAGLVLFGSLAVGSVVLILIVATAGAMEASKRKKAKSQVELESEFRFLIGRIRSSLKQGTEPIPALLDSAKELGNDSRTSYAVGVFHQCLRQGLSRKVAYQALSNELRLPQFALLFSTFSLAETNPTRIVSMLDEIKIDKFA